MHKKLAAVVSQYLASVRIKKIQRVANSFVAEQKTDDEWKTDKFLRTSTRDDGLNFFLIKQKSAINKLHNYLPSWKHMSYGL